MANFKTWVESTRAGNFLVRHRDGKTRLSNGRMRVYTDYCIEKNEVLFLDNKKLSGKRLAESMAEKVKERYYKGELGHVDSDERVEDLIDEFLAIKRSERKAIATIVNYTTNLSKLSEEIPILRDLTTKNLQEWKAKLQKQNYSHDSIYGRMNVTNTFCNWLVRQEKLMKSPIQKGMVGSVAPSRPRFFTTDEFLNVDTVLAKLNPFARIGFRLAHDYGLRMVEIIGDKFDRPHGVLFEDLIWRSDGKVDLFVRKEYTKGQKKDRKLRLDASFIQMLGSRKSGPLVPMKRDKFRELIMTAIKMAGVKRRLTPHGLRHTFAKDFLQRSGSNQAALRDLMGHCSIKTTEIYSHFEETHLDLAMEKLHENSKKEGLLAGQITDKSIIIAELNGTPSNIDERIRNVNNAPKN